MSSSPPPTSSPSPPAASPPPVAASPPASSPPPAASSPPPTVTLSPPPVSSPPPVQPSPPVVSPPAPSVSNPPPPIVTPPATPVLPPPASSPPPATPVVTPPSSSSPPPAPPSRLPPSKSPPPAIPSVPPPPTSPSTPSTPSPPVTPSTPSTPSRGSPPSPPVATTNTPSTSVSRPPPSSSSSSSSVSIPVIVGIAGAAVALIAILSILVCCCRRKKRSYSSPSPPHGLMPMPPPRKEEMYGLQPQNLQHNFPPPEDHFVKIPPPAAPPVISSRNGSGSNYSAGDSKNPPQASGIALGYLKSVFTYEELAIATDGFSDANLLGQGGFGFVHRGVLSNGEEVAVKQLKSGSGQGEREFHAEVEIISRVHHKHLVSLVGYSTSGGKRLLVYEFVPNNTLEFHLHGKGRPTMDWPTRLKIALGSAKGLAYLHEDCHPKIIHRDIKAANILLDYNFEPKVADFGLAKFASEENTHVSTRVMGTFGYLSPEYAATGKLTDKSDVFSFGVMLLELITGRRPVDQTNTHMAESLVDWARPLLTKALEDNRNFDALVDPKLQNNYDAADMAHMVACAAAAVRHSARHRPRMSQIVRALEGDASLEELNDGVRPGQSSIYTSYSSSDYDDSHYKNMGKFRKLGLNSEDFAASDSGPVRTNSNGRPKDYRDTVSSDCSGGTSEYGQNPSGSSSEGVPSQEMELRMKNRASGS